MLRQSFQDASLMSKAADFGSFGLSRSGAATLFKAQFASTRRCEACHFRSGPVSFQLVTSTPTHFSQPPNGQKGRKAIGPF